MVKRWISPSLFALTALCFALPFATVSCDGATTSFTGIQIVTHTVPHGGHLDEGPDCDGDIGDCVERRTAVPATLALAAALAGVLLGYFAIARGPGWLALAALLSLLWMPFEGLFADIHFRAGYVGAVVLTLAAWLLHLGRAIGRWRAKRRRRALGSLGGHGARAAG